MKKILLIHPEGNINNNPNLTGIVEILCENGYAVEIVSPRRSDIFQKPPCAGSSLRLVDIPVAVNAHIHPFLIPSELSPDSEELSNHLRLAFDDADLVIGVDRGIIDASRLAKNLNVPFGLISYEIYFAEETGAEFKEPEITACNGISFAVCQDRVRSAHLSRENHIPIDKIIDIPVAGRSSRRGDRSYALNELLGIGKDKKIALYIGAVVLRWAAVSELIDTASVWPDDWVLVLHHNYGNAREALANKGALKNVYPSPLPPLPNEKMDTLLHSADLGIAFYKPLRVKGNFTDGNNLRYIGMASGKIPSYIQHGLPVMINEIGEMSAHVREQSLGSVVGSFSEIPSSLHALTADTLAGCRENCYRFFEARLDLNVTISPLLKTISSLLYEEEHLSADLATKTKPAELSAGKGLTIVAPDNYTNKSWYEEAARLFGEDAEVAILPSPSGAGFEKICFREKILFLGASHHLPGLFDSDEKIRFWNSIPSKKYFYQYERSIGSYWPENESKERRVHTINAEVYAVQDEYDAAAYEDIFGTKARWLPDMVSAERIRRGTGYPPLFRRPIDLLFIGKIGEAWYKNRQEILKKVAMLASAMNLRATVIDTSHHRLTDSDIEKYYSQAKVVINPIGAGNFFNIRFFEALAAGCICLQQVEKEGVPLKRFMERFKDYNAVYFTSDDLGDKILATFSDISRFEQAVPKTHFLLLQNDAGEARFEDLGIIPPQSSRHRARQNLRPIIFIHKGDSDYLQYTIKCARAFNPDATIILLGDKSNRKYKDLGIEHFFYKDYDGDEARLFDKVFQYIAGKDHRREEWWVRFVFKRWFHIYYFIESQKIKRFWTFDSDTLILCDLSLQADKFNNYDCTEQCNGICMNGFINGPGVIKGYLEKIIELFQDEKYLSEQKEEFRTKTGWAFTEMRAYDAYKRSTPIKTIRLNTILGGETFDDAIFQDHDMEMERGIKRLYFRNGSFYFKHLPGEEYVKVNSLNMSAVPTSYIKEIFEKSLTKDAASERNRIQSSDNSLPVHFFTIVLNGEPFIRHHIEVFKELPFRWHWHIIEGVADLKHDTAWSLQFGARITDDLHKNGLSNDGTTEYLDEIIGQHPENITIYRKQRGEFWDGKLEMVMAPLVNIREECLLWQVDADELWTIEQIVAGHSLFRRHPEKTAAYYFCHYFVGEKLVISTRNTYGNNTSYEWLRSWRFKPGDMWISHEPPRLCRQSPDSKWIDLAKINTFSHAETEAQGLIFQHFAYATEAQLFFKERYFGYAGAVEQWQHLQSQNQFPVFLKDYFRWVKDNAVVNTSISQGIHPTAEKDHAGKWQFKQHEPSADGPTHILWIRTDSIGDNVLASSMLPYIREKYSRATITVVCQEQVAELYKSCPIVDDIITFNKTRANQDKEYLNNISGSVQALEADLALNSVYSREPLTDFLAIGSLAKERIAMEGDLCNIECGLRDAGNKYYSRILSLDIEQKPEIEKHKEFLKGLGIVPSYLKPLVWLSADDEEFAEDFFAENNLEPDRTIALFAGAQFDVRIYEHYGRALSQICKDNSFTVVALGSSLEHGINQQNLNEIDVKTINLSGKTTLRQSAALLSRCKLAVGAETGLAHIACAVCTPNVILLGGGHFGRFMPYSPFTTAVCLPIECYNCNWRCKYQRVHCVKDVSYEVLREAIRQSLDRFSVKTRIFVQGESLWSPEDGQPKWKIFSKYIDTKAVEIIPIEKVSDDIPDAGLSLDRR